MVFISGYGSDVLCCKCAFHQLWADFSYECKSAFLVGVWFWDKCFFLFLFLKQLMLFLVKHKDTMTMLMHLPFYGNCVSLLKLWCLFHVMHTFNYNIVLCSAPYFELLGEASFNMADLFMDMFNSNIVYLHLQNAQLY